MVSVSQAVFLIGAGALAGIVGTAGGITSLVSYPALLVAGLAARPAGVANIVAVAACWPGAALASQPEVRGRGGWLLRWGVFSAVGGAAGAALLLSTPSALFSRIAPVLIALGSLALLLQPRLAVRRQRARGGRSLILPAGLLSFAIYGGYFGAGSGVMTLALLMVTVEDHLARANALKNMLVGAVSIASAAAFVAVGHVDWGAAIPLGIGMFAGSTGGPQVARRLPPDLLRWVIAAIGLGLAVALYLGAVS